MYVQGLQTTTDQLRDGQSIRFGQFSLLALPNPPLAEQQAIAGFLGRETTKIDTLIAKQEQLITTLGERRQAVISRAVTTGLDTDVVLEESGIEWYGVKPSHWVMSKICRSFHLTLGKTVNGGDEKTGFELPYLRAANIQDFGIDLSEVKRLFLSASEVRRLQLVAGDVVVVEGGGGYGRSDLLRFDMEGWAFQNHVIRLRSRPLQSSAFLNYFIKHLRSIGHFERLASFATIPNVSADKLGQIEFPNMPFAEAESIASYLDEETKKIDASIEKAAEIVCLLAERRQSLISAAVTGELEVAR
jgi:type I restriction enzyme S subunit